jgi:hypothetical protein
MKTATREIARGEHAVAQYPTPEAAIDAARRTLGEYLMAIWPADGLAES